MHIKETTLLPYTRPRERLIPSIKPTINEKMVRINVTDRPLRSFGKESIKNSQNPVAAVFPHSLPYKVEIFPRNCFVLSIFGFWNICFGGPFSTITPPSINMISSATFRANPIS